MKSTNRTTSKLTALTALAALLRLTDPATVPGAESKLDNLGVMPVGSQAFGKTDGEWLKDWFIWVEGFPAPSQHPVYDTNGAFASLGQSNGVWFLCNEEVQKPVTRQITVPAGEPFLVVLDYVVWITTPQDIKDGLPSDDEIWAIIRDDLDLRTNLLCEIDGQSVQNLRSYRVRSPTFSYTFPGIAKDQIFFNYWLPGGANDDYAVPSGWISTPTMGEAFALLVPPMPAGRHTLHWSYFNPTQGAAGVFHDITYSITVAVAATIPAAIRLDSLRLNNGDAGLTIKGPPGAPCQIQATSSLGPEVTWQNMAILTLTNGVHLWNDSTSLGHFQRFYRAISLPKLAMTSPATNNLTAGPTNFIWISPGTFIMGSPSTEADRLSGEGPQTEVTFTQGFWMSKYLVTQGDYQAVMANDPSVFTGRSQNPVEQVTWYDATNYCGRLTTQERTAGRVPLGYVYRLPTSAEWEYVCRAGTTTRFSYGDDPDYSQLKDYAWYVDNSQAMPHPVGAKRANPWGFYDMHGNVWEWCLDYYALPGGRVTDPRGSSSGSVRMIRGGCWGNVDSSCRSATQAIAKPSDRGARIGFRVVLAPGT